MLFFRIHNVGFYLVKQYYYIFYRFHQIKSVLNLDASFCIKVNIYFLDWFYIIFLMRLIYFNSFDICLKSKCEITAYTMSYNKGLI